MTTVGDEDDPTPFAREARKVPGQCVVEQQVLPRHAAAVDLGIDVDRADCAVIPPRYQIRRFDFGLLVEVGGLFVRKERAMA